MWRITKIPSPRQQEAWELIAEGNTRKETAWKMNITPKTLDTMLSNLYLKLDFPPSGNHAVRLARLWMEREAERRYREETEW